MARKESSRDQIIELLIDNQSFIKNHVMELKLIKNELLKKENPVFIPDMQAQYDARINQWISFYVAERLAIPAEYVIIILEGIEIDDYLNV